MGHPEKKFRCGGCEAAIFENEYIKDGKPLTVKKVSFQKRYKIDDGDWKSTNSLDVNDIPKAVMVLNKAFEYITLKSEELNAEFDDPE